METTLNHNDPDLKIALKIGSLIDNGLPLAEELQGEEEWLDYLLKWKTESAHIYRESSLQESGLTWSAIDPQLASVLPTSMGNKTDRHLTTDKTGEIDKTGKSRKPIIRKIRPAAAWYAVAAVLTIAFLGGIFLYISSTSHPVIVESTHSIVVYDTPDGSLITLRPWSKLTKLVHSNGVLAYSIEGEAYFEVVHDAGRVFQVDAGAGTVTVLGTRFTARNTGSESSVYLQNGSVRLTSTVTSESRILEPGHEGTVDLGGNFAEPVPLTTEEGIGWVYQQLNFVGKPAERIFSELEQHFNIRIVYPDAIAGDTVTGRILLNDRQQALDDAGIALGGRFEIRNDGVYAFISD